MNIEREKIHLSSINVNNDYFLNYIKKFFFTRIKKIRCNPLHKKKSRLFLLGKVEKLQNDTNSRKSVHYSLNHIVIPQKRNQSLIFKGRREIFIFKNDILEWDQNEKKILVQKNIDIFF